MTNTTQKHDGDDGGIDDATFTVQIIAASAVVRAGLAALVGADERFDVTGSFSSAGEAIQEIELAENTADLIIAEIGESSADEITELAATTERDESDGPAIVALIPASQPISVASLLRNGVSAVLPNTATGAEIIAAAEAALAGLIVLPREMLWLITEARDTPEENPERTPPDHEAHEAHASHESLFEALTHRELQVLDLMAQGLGNKEIARELRISEHTVKFHVSSILGKLAASSRTEAVTHGLRMGLITM